MPNCAVGNCKNSNKNTRDAGIKFFSFPMSKDCTIKWINACRRQDQINLKNATICSIHFEQKYIEIPMKQRLLNYFPMNTRLLTDDAVPTLNLPGGSSDATPKRKAEERLQMIAKRRRREEVNDIINSTSSTSGCTVTAEVEEHNIETKATKEELELPKNDEQLISTLPITESLKERDHAELVELRQKVEILESEKSATSEKYNTLLARVFTPGQIKKLFNPKLEEDMENQVKYNLMPHVSIKLKEGVVPHKFECQKDKSNTKTRKLVLDDCTEEIKVEVKILDDTDSNIPENETLMDEQLDQANYPNTDSRQLKKTRSEYDTPSYIASDEFNTLCETEFDVWAKSVAMQLNGMDVRRALKLQLAIQTLVTNERLAYERPKDEFDAAAVVIKEEPCNNFEGPE